MKWLAKPSGEGRLGPQAIYESPLAKSFSSYYYLGSMRKDHSRMLPRVSYSQDHSKKSHFTFSKTKPRKPLQKYQQSHNAFAQTQTNLSTLSTPKTISSYKNALNLCPNSSTTHCRLKTCLCKTSGGPSDQEDQPTSRTTLHLRPVAHQEHLRHLSLLDLKARIGAEIEPLISSAYRNV